MPKSRRSTRPATKKPSAAPPALVSCTDCGKCCTYVAIEIDGPSSVRNATLMLWYLYHEGTSLYRDVDGEWVVQFESRCRHLTKDRRCGIYEVRPHICRQFDEKHCEVNTGDDGQTFTNAAQLLEYLRVNRPRMHAKLAAGYARGEDLMPRSAPRRRLPIAPVHTPLS
jgi:Fe-S-cluster containining protein